MMYEPLPVHTAEQIDAMSGREYKTLETRLRRAADRQGLRLEKSRTRDPRAIDYGTYQLVDALSYGGVVYADWNSPQRSYGLDLGDVAHWLNGDVK